MLTWDEACDTVLETTELGWTLKSLDKIWLAATVETDTDDYPELAGNAVFATVEKAGSYELWSDVACFRSRREAETFIESMGKPYNDWWFPLNHGDLTRWEHAFLNGQIRDLTGRGYRPKYRGSQDWFDYKYKVCRKLPQYGVAS